MNHFWCEHRREIAPRLPRHRRGQRIPEPTRPFDHALQHLARRNLGVECQRDGIIDHDVGAQIPLPRAAALRLEHHRLHDLQRKLGHQHSKSALIGQLNASRQSSGSPSLYPHGDDRPDLTLVPLTEQY